MKEIVGGKPQRVGEVEGEVHVDHWALAGWHGNHPSVIDAAQNGEQEKREIGQNCAKKEGRRIYGNPPALEGPVQSGCNQEMRVGLHWISAPKLLDHVKDGRAGPRGGMTK
jgi:hypothetical protein